MPRSETLAGVCPARLARDRGHHGEGRTAPASARGLPPRRGRSAGQFPHSAPHACHAAAAGRGAVAGDRGDPRGHSDTRMTERHYTHLVRSHVAQVIRATMPKLGLVEQSLVVRQRAPERPVRRISGLTGGTTLPRRIRGALRRGPGSHVRDFTRCRLPRRVARPTQRTASQDRGRRRGGSSADSPMDILPPPLDQPVDPSSPSQHSSGPSAQNDAAINTSCSRA
jgi:hypothetical protein